jgi:hypothetical protein
MERGRVPRIGESADAACARRPQLGVMLDSLLDVATASRGSTSRSSRSPRSTRSSRYLKRVLREGLRIALVPVPALYGDERSSFRAGRDSARVLWALVAPAGVAGRRGRVRRQANRFVKRRARPEGAWPGV